MARTRGISKAFALTLAAVLTVASAAWVLTPGADAQSLKTDPNAAKNKQPGIGSGTGKTGTPVPVITITAPNAGGVSHNVWKDFNVGKPGMVFNNATQAGQSQLAGALGPNANLTSGPAKLILNEVTGGNISQLLGYIEIFGHSADFVLANPAGITCNGCGFINTPHATLTTGLADFNGDGSLKGFTVSGSGSIRFEGTGANVTGVETFDVVSRSIFMGGAIDDSALAAEVGLFAGRNSFDYASRTVTALSDDGTKKPGYAIDTNAAGAIHAGKIGITSTEKGVAARTAADMQASAGGMTLTADGKLVVAKARSQGAIQAKSLSSDIQIAGQVWSQAALDLWAGGNIAVLSQASAGALGNVTVNAQGISLDAGAVLGAGLDDQGKFTGSGTLNLYAVDVSNAGTLKATQDVNIAVSGDLTNGLAAQAPTTQNIGWLGFYPAPQAPSTGTASTAGGVIEAGRNLTVNAGKGINGTGGKFGAGTDLALNAGGDVNLQATNLSSGRNTQIAAQGQVTLTGAQSTSQTQKSCDWLGFACKTTVTVTAASPTINAGGWVQIESKTKDVALKAVNVTAQGDIKLLADLGNVLVSGGRGTASQSSTTNSSWWGATGSTGSPQAATPSLVSAQGSIVLTAGGSVANILSTMSAAGGVTVNAGKNFENLSGTIQGQDVTVNAQTIENVTLVSRNGQLMLPPEYAGAPDTSTSVAAPGLLATLTSQNSGLLSSFGLKLDGVSATSAHTDVAATQASITATNGVTLNASKDINNIGGKVTATNGDLTVNAGGSTNILAQEVSTVRDANNLTTTHVKSALTAGGNVTINAGGDATIQATDVKSGKNTTVTAGGAVTLSAAQDEKKTYSSSESCDWLGFSCKTTVHSTDDKTVVASTFTSGGWIEIEAKTGDIHATATNANAQGSIKLLSDKGNILADAGENSTYNQSYTKKSQWWGLTGSAHNSIDSSTTIEPTWVSAVNDVQLITHADLTLKAATVKAGGSIDISAQTITFIALQNTVYHYQMDENWGFYASAGTQQGSASVSVGWQDTKTTSSTKEGLAQVTDIEAGGNISIAAKGDINSEGAIVAASGSVTANAGGDINLTAAYDTYTATSSKSSTQIGLTLSANENVSTAIKTFENAGKDFNAGQGSDAAKNITRASEALKLVETAANLVFGQLVSVSASIGFSHSTSNSSLTEHLVHAGYWVAGNDVSIASGNNVNIQGTVSQAGRCLSVAAANNLTVQSALSTIDQKTSFQSESASVGVSFGVGLTGFSLAGNASVGFQTGDSSMHQATNVMSQLSGGTVALKSGRDTTIAGAAVTGGTVTADVGGSLSVESRQDTLTSRNSQTGFSLGIGIGLGSVSSTAGPGSYAPSPTLLSDTGAMLGNAGSFLAGGGPFGNAGAGSLTNAGNPGPLHNTGSFGFTYVRGSEDKAWTNSLTTINGTNGTTLNVTGNTNVKGAVIESGAGTPLNINTGTFTYENIKDYDKTKNISASVNVTIPLGSFSWQQPASSANPAASGQSASAAASPPAPPTLSMLVQLSQGLAQAGQYLGQYPTKVQVSYKATDKEGTTFATVGAGNINVSDTAKQAALEKDGKTGALAKLNRDVTKTQIVTKDTVESFNIFVSTQSLQTIATIASKAVALIDEMVSQGKLLPGAGDEAKKVIDFIKKYGLPASICNEAGGSSGSTNTGFLHNLRDFLISPAYASFDANHAGCQLFFNGKLGYLDVSSPAYQAARQAIVDEAAQFLKDNLASYDNLVESYKAGTITHDQLLLLNSLRTAANVFALCSDNGSDLAGILSLSPNFYSGALLYQAQLVRSGGDILAFKIKNGDPTALQYYDTVAAQVGNGSDYREFPYGLSKEVRYNNTMFAAFMLQNVNASTPQNQAEAIIQVAMGQLSLATSYPLVEVTRQRVQAVVDLVRGGLTPEQQNIFDKAYKTYGLDNIADPGVMAEFQRRVLSLSKVYYGAELAVVFPGAIPYMGVGVVYSEGRYIAYNQMTGRSGTFEGYANAFGQGELGGGLAYAYLPGALVVGGYGLANNWGQITTGAWNYGQLDAQARTDLKAEAVLSTVDTLLFFGGINALKGEGPIQEALPSPSYMRFMVDSSTGRGTWYDTRGWTIIDGEPAANPGTGSQLPVLQTFGNGLSILYPGAGQLPAGYFYAGAGSLPGISAAIGGPVQGTTFALPAPADGGLPAGVGAPGIYVDLEVIGGGPSRGKIAPFNPQGLRDVCAYATCGHIRSVLDGVPYTDLEAISDAYSAKQLLFDAGQWRVPDGKNTLTSVFPWGHPAIISSDRAMSDLFFGNDLSLTPLITANVDIANLAEGAYVIKIQGTPNVANVIESHVQSLIVGLDAQVRTNGAFDRYIYDARDSTLITDFSIYQNGNIRFYKVTPTGK